MSSLQDRLDSLVGLEARAAEINRQVGSAQSEIVAAIRAGESSGDKIKDFLRVIGDWSFQQDQPLRDLDARLQGKSGEPVLALEMTHNLEEDHHDLGCRDITTINFYFSKIDGELSFNLGERIYSIERGRIREPRFIIPAKQHLYSRTEINDFNLGDPNAELYPNSTLNWKVVNEPLSLDTQGIFPQLPNVPTQLGILPTRIYVGKEVEDYFTNPQMNKYEKEVSLYSYINAAKVLNLDVPTALQQRIGEMITAEKDRTAQLIIKAYIEGLTIPSDPLYPLIFRHALELGMDQEPRTVELKGGATLDLPRYISKFCSEHEIKPAEEQ